MIRSETTFRLRYERIMKSKVAVQLRKGSAAVTFISATGALLTWTRGSFKCQMRIPIVDHTWAWTGGGSSVRIQENSGRNFSKISDK